MTKQQRQDCLDIGVSLAFKEVKTFGHLLSDLGGKTTFYSGVRHYLASFSLGTITNKEIKEGIKRWSDLTKKYDRKIMGEPK